jgi:hypothetical protein
MRKASAHQFSGSSIYWSMSAPFYSNFFSASDDGQYVKRLDESCERRCKRKQDNIIAVQRCMCMQARECYDCKHFMGDKNEKISKVD